MREVDEVAGDQARSQIEAICSSQTFRNRDSFRRLLAYLCDKTLDGTAENLKEYVLGLDLYGKPDSYDPREDASVRVQISKLRQKLEEYYLSEGKDDAILVELPRRHLALKFQRRAGSGQTGDAVPGSAPISRRRRLAIIAASAVVLFGIGLLTGRYLGRNTADGPAQPELRSFWGPLLDNRKPIVVCLGTPLFVRFQGARVRSQGIEDFDTAQNDPKLKKIQGIIGSPTMQPSYVFTGVGEAGGAFQLAALFAHWNRDLKLRRNPSLTWEEIRENNVIVLGSAKFNPQLRNLPSEQAFVVEQEGVANLKPQSGEPAKYLRRYSSDSDRSILEDYAVISRLPGVNGQGEIVVLGGSATEGTAAAVDCVTDPLQLRRLFAAIKGKDGRILRHFEAVIRVEFRAMVPVNINYVSWRPRQ
jgi:hypothetical protein